MGVPGRSSVSARRTIVVLRVVLQRVEFHASRELGARRRRVARGAAVKAISAESWPTVEPAMTGETCASVAPPDRGETDGRKARAIDFWDTTGLASRLGAQE